MKKMFVLVCALHVVGTALASEGVFPLKSDKLYCSEEDVIGTSGQERKSSAEEAWYNLLRPDYRPEDRSEIAHLKQP